MKKIVLFILLFAFVKNAEAIPFLLRFGIHGNYLSNGKLLVNNVSSTTNFKVDVSLLGKELNKGDECYVTILYTENPSYFQEASAANDYESHPSTIELSTIKFVKFSDYEYGIANFVYASGPKEALSATLPAYKYTGKILLRYKYYDGSLGREVIRYSSNRYEIHLSSSATISNDNYTGATDLGVTVIFGTTKNATHSPQLPPSCYNPPQYVMTKDVWYKFIATSSNHTMNITNNSFEGNSYGTPYVATALYNSSLNVLNCFSNNTATFSNLTIGETYYIRCWAGNANSQMTMNFNISLASNGANVITGISRSGGSLEHILTTSYFSDPSIPASDITFEWAVWPGEVEPANDYSVIQGIGSHQIHIIGGPNEGDTTVRAKVRMKRISTGEPLTDWYVYSSLIWFG